MELTIEQQAKGTRILTGALAKERRSLINAMIAIAEEFGFEEIVLPSVEKAQVYTDKAGPEILGQMYAFPDKGGRELCLRPEGTATVQLLADKHWKQQEKKLWYVERCWRYENPQLGRHREFTQFGIEWINPKHEDPTAVLVEMAEKMVKWANVPYEVSIGVKRGLSYYTGNGFEISIPSLGAQKQAVGAGPYKQGVGFAVGVDRLLLAKTMPHEEKVAEKNVAQEIGEKIFLNGKRGKFFMSNEASIDRESKSILEEFTSKERDYYYGAEQRAFLHGCRLGLDSSSIKGKWSVQEWNELEGGIRSNATSVCLDGDQVGSFLDYRTALNVVNFLNACSAEVLDE